MKNSLAGSFLQALQPYGSYAEWNPDLLWTHIVADLFITFAYFAIPLLLFYIAWKKKYARNYWVLAIGSLFILTSGSVHLMSFLSFFRPVFLTEGIIKVATALTAVVTMAVLAKNATYLISLPGQKEWQQMNEDLKERIRYLEEKENIIHTPQEALRESEERCRALSNVFDSVIIEGDNQILFINRAGLNLLGVNSREELKGKSILDFTHPDYITSLQNRIAHVKKGNSLAQLEEKIIRPDGSEAAIEVIASPFMYNGITSAQIIARDITERKQREEAFRQSEERFRLLVEGVKDYAIFMLNTEGHITTWNEGAKRTKGYTEEEIIGKHFSIFYTQEDQEKGIPERALEEARATGRFEAESWRIRRDHSKFWASVVITAMRNEAGEIIGFSKITRDLTERKRAEDALYKNEEQFHCLVEGVKHHAIFMLAPDGILSTWNQGVKRIKGYEADEFIGQHFRMLFPEEYVKEGKPEKEMQQAKENGLFVSTDWRQRKDGSLFWAELHLTPIYNNQKVFIGFTKVAKDLTEQKKQEEKLRESEAKFRRLFESDMIGNFFWDTSGRITEANDAFLRIVGYSQEELQKGKISWTTMTPAEYEPLDKKALEELATSGIITPFEKEYIRKDGNHIPVLVGGAMLEGYTERGAAFAMDITDLKRVQTELEKRAEELTQSNAALEQFAYVASHDLQEPLRTITAFAQMLNKKHGSQLDKEANEFINYMISATGRMQALITNLLSYSKARSQNQSFSMINLSDVLKQVMENLQLGIAETGAQITYNNLPLLEANEWQMVQLFQNMISNALKFRDNRIPQIHIQAEESESDWLISVKDNGIGIDLMYADRIFQVFKRLHTRSEYEGSGIGLATCKNIVEIHGGHIWLESVVGQGSTFFFTLKKKH